MNKEEEEKKIRLERTYQLKRRIIVRILKRSSKKEGPKKRRLRNLPLNS